MMAIIKICNSGSFYCFNRKLSIRLQLRLPGYTFPQYLFHHQLTYLSMIKEKEKVFVLFFIHQVTIEGAFVFKNIMPDWLDYSSNRLDPRS